jgi:hypothetical protein
VKRDNRLTRAAPHPVSKKIVRENPKRVYALKGLYILAQGNALGNTETDTSALKGRDIGYTLMCG